VKDNFWYRTFSPRKAGLAAARIADNFQLRNGLPVGDVPLFNSHSGKVANY